MLTQPRANPRANHFGMDDRGKSGGERAAVQTLRAVRRCLVVAPASGLRDSAVALAPLSKRPASQGRCLSWERMAGYLISNYHVVKDAKWVRVVTSTGTVSAEVVRVDAANDLALLKASNKQFSLSAEEFLDAPNKLRLNLRRCPLRRAAP